MCAQGPRLLIPNERSSSTSASNAIDRELVLLVRRHYGLRGFGSVLVDMLCEEMDRRRSVANLCIAKGRWESIERLHDVSRALDQASELDELEGLSPDLISPPCDWTTAEVLSHFVKHLRETALSGNRSIIVASHLHHSGRCSFLLSRAGFEALTPPAEVEVYADYEEEEEAQPRFRSGWDYLLNDFLALCRILGSARDRAMLVPKLRSSVN